MIVRPEPNTDNPLWEYFCRNRNRVIYKWHHYFDIYHNHFRRFRNKPVKILEIGILQGGSLQMWKDYFGQDAMIFGVDIKPKCKRFEEDRIKIFIGDQADRNFLKRVRDQIGMVDILIDDGGHTMEQQIATFEELYPAVSETGIYLVEDLHTSYWEEYGGGFKNPGSFIEYSKRFIDSIHAWHSRSPELKPDFLTKSATGIHFYDSVLVIEKYPNHTKPRVSKTGEGIDDQTIQTNQKDEVVITPPDETQSSSPSGGDAAHLYLDLMEKCLTDLIYAQDHEKFNLQGRPFDDQRRIEGREWPLRAHTMIGLKRLENIKFCVNDVLARGVEGDLIEAGVWRGGAAIFMRAILRAYNISDRNVWVADSFEGLPPPSAEQYPADAGDKHHQFKELAVSMEQVMSNFERYDLLDRQVKFLKGRFNDTLPNTPMEKLAVIQLDGDMYGSTMEALNALYPKLSVGGYIIIDDYEAIEGCKKAVHDFRERYHITDEIISIDWTGAYWRRTQ